MNRHKSYNVVQFASVLLKAFLQGRFPSSSFQMEAQELALSPGLEKEGKRQITVTITLRVEEQDLREWTIATEHLDPMPVVIGSFKTAVIQGNGPFWSEPKISDVIEALKRNGRR